MTDPIRDCPHGHMKGKCDSCELVVAEQRIAALENVRNMLATIVAAHVAASDEDSIAGQNLIEQCYYWYGVDSSVYPVASMRLPCGECHLKNGEICDICGAKNLNSAGYGGGE